ncbi:hypothetical protein BTA51_26290 [Hahella sp. CCB-MM4]|nr:hypothetical protein BTA51_26290 [Hahella sp. CCB-MM4]
MGGVQKNVERNYWLEVQTQNRCSFAKLKHISFRAAQNRRVLSRDRTDCELVRKFETRER